MPLVLLGLLFVIGIVIYALVRYGNSDDVDDRPVRERYSHAFPPRRRGRDDGFDYEFENDEDRTDTGDARSPGANGHRGESGDGHTMYFPDDAEVEKRKRNIH